MTIRGSRAGRRVGAFALLVVLLAGCSSAVTGHGSGGSSSPSTTASTPDFPSGSASTSGSGSVPPSVASSTPTYQVVTVRGTTTGRAITVRVYAQDTIADCAAHAYGTTMIAFLRAHPCRGAKRVLGTTVVDGRTVVLSLISTGFAGTSQDEYGAAARFQKLERAGGTGSINDLLREGHTIPGVASRIPEDEMFLVLGQDQGVAVFDAWYQDGRSSSDDTALKDLGMELFLTSLTTG